MIRTVTMSSTLAAFTVLERIARDQPVGLSELARNLDLPKSTVQRCLATLHEAGWIETESAGSRRWVLAMHAFAVAVTVIERAGLRDRALPVMSQLSAETGETIHLAIPDGQEIVLVERIDSPHTLRAASAVGSRSPLHASSNGKAVLAVLPEEELRSYLSHGLSQVTRHTLTDEATLRADLEQTRSQGYAVNHEELQDGVVSVASAIRARNGQPVASLSISGPRDRMPEATVQAYGPLVVRAASDISKRLLPYEPFSS